MYSQLIIINDANYSLVNQQLQNYKRNQLLEFLFILNKGDMVCCMELFKIYRRVVIILCFENNLKINFF